MNEIERVTDAQWKAIANNDSAYDNKFIYALRTTGIFCKPSCKSRLPNRRNVRTFHHATEALSAGFRPCKRCKPTHARLPDEEWADEIARFLEAHYVDELRLHTIADNCHGSPYHLHRIFKRVKGLTPMEYLQQLRINHAKEQLQHSSLTITRIAGEAGFPNVSYFITLFKKVTGYTPAMYREITRTEAGQEHRVIENGGV